VASFTVVRSGDSRISRPVTWWADTGETAPRAVWISPGTQQGEPDRTREIIMNHRLLTSLKLTGVGLAMLGAAVITGAAADAATPGSYQLTSSTYSVAAVHNTGRLTGECAVGYHVEGAWGTPIGATPDPANLAPGPANLTPDPANLTGGAVWSPNVTAHGDWISVSTTSGVAQNGTDSNGHPTFQGLSVQLYNASLIHSHDGSFTWTCDPN
jgi:hypothetical protein